MSDSVPSVPLGLAQSQTSVLGPGIVSLFIQGIETGLVFAHFTRWFSACDLKGSYLDSIIIIIVTAVGLAQSGICFASAWGNYVQQFGKFLLPSWEDYVQPIPTLFISVPVQALMIRRCYMLAGRNLFTIIPLVLLLLASIILSLWSIVILLDILPVEGHLPSLPKLRKTVSWPFLVSVLLPSILDLILMSIMLYCLIRKKEHVYATQMRQLISHFVNIAWQSALPPTFCSVCITAFYLLFSTSHKKKMGFWLTVAQAMIGKLYVLSLFYQLNARYQLPDQLATGIPSTLTVPTEVMCARTRMRDVSHGEDIAKCGYATTEGSAV